MPTIRDVAQAAGVSVSTVSNILNNKAGVSEDKYQRVMQAIRDLKYNPNFLASNLKANKSPLVAIVLPELTNDSRLAVSAMIDALAARHYTAMVRLTHHNPLDEAEALEEFLLMGVAGILLNTCGADRHDWFRQAREREIPLVFFEGYPAGAEYTAVLYDNRHACRRLADEIRTRHGEGAVIVTGPLSYRQEQDCLDGYREGGLADVPAYAVRLGEDLAFIDFAAIAAELGTLPPVCATTGPDIARAIRRVAALYGREPVIYTLAGEEAGDTAIREPRRLGRTAAGTLLEYMASPVFFESRHIVLASTAPPLRGTVSAVPPCTLRALLFDGPTAAALTRTLSAFAHRQGVHVECERLDYAALHDRIAAGDHEADVLMVDYPWMGTLGTGQYLQPLAPLREAPDDMEAYPAEVRRMFVAEDGAYNTLPVVINLQLLFYRRDLFGDPAIRRRFFRQYGIELSPPKTWRDFEIIAQFFTQSMNANSPVPYGTTLQGLDPIFMAEEFFPRQWAYKGKILSSTGKLLLNSNENARAMANLKAVYDCTPKPARQSDWPVEARRLIDGDIAMQFTFSTHVPSVASPDPGSVDYRSIGIAPAPGRRPMLGGWFLGVSRQSANPQAGARLIDWLAGEENARAHTLLGAFIPRKSVFNDLRCQQIFPWISHMQAGLSRAGDRELLTDADGNKLGSTAVDTVVYDGVRQVLNGAEPSQALQGMQTAMERLLGE